MTILGLITSLSVIEWWSIGVMALFQRPIKAFIFAGTCCLLLLCVLWFQVIAEETNDFLSITGPCKLVFPRDHGPHPGYRTEWWYYTGNLKDESGNPYGFQLTFFRSQISPPGNETSWPRPTSAWRTQQIYLGHAAVSDIRRNLHFQAEITSREVLGVAGASRQSTKTYIFIHNWAADIKPDSHRLSAQSDDFSYELELVPAKPPILHGDAGYSRKGSTAGRASCYYSFTRLKTTGIVKIQGKTLRVDGMSWMDHEFSTAPLEPGLSGWDWFSLQLNDETEIMIYLLRKKDNGFSPASSGTFVDASGKTQHLTVKTFHVKVIDTWKSPNSNAVYPSKWRIKIPTLSTDLTIAPNLSNQEMRSPNTTNVTYWEGSVSVTGTKKDKSIKGHGYVELTGYAEPFDAPM
jgi:predicted secreted hydrolase